MPAIEFRDLHRRFGRVRVLSGVSGSAGAGEVLLVTGANGSGKSTLLRCLAGLLAPDRGEVRMTAGERVLEPAERRRAVGYVAPDLAFYEPLTTAENLAFFARLRGADPGRGAALLDRVGLSHRSAARPRALSVGEQQRVAIARAVANRPKVVLADEPTANLDEKNGDTVLALLRETVAEAGAILVLVTHERRIQERFLRVVPMAERVR